jgi:lipopolysaccharide export system permease protein
VRLLQRYILGELLRVFIFLLTVLMVLLVFVGVFQQAQENGLGPYQIIQILPYIIPSMLPYTIPAALLLTVSIVYGRISGDLEVTAAKAAGISVMTLLTPALTLGLVLAFSSFVLTDRVIPWAFDNIQRVVTQAMEEIFLDVLRTSHNFVDENQGYRITVGHVDGRKLIEPTFRYRVREDKWVVIAAQEATLDFDLEQEQLILHLVHAEFSAPGAGGIIKKDNQPIPLPHHIRKPRARHLTVSEINREIRDMELSRAGNEAQRDVAAAMYLALGDFSLFESKQFQNYQATVGNTRRRTLQFHTEVHGRYAMAASCFFFVLLGGPFAILQGSKHFLTSFVLCFIPILLVYYPLVFLAMNLSTMGSISPVWGVWAANGVLMLAGLFFLHRVLKH